MGAGDLVKKTRTQSRRNQWKVSLFCSFSIHIFLSLSQHKSQNSIAGMDKKSSKRILFVCFLFFVLSTGKWSLSKEDRLWRNSWSFFLSLSALSPASPTPEAVAMWQQEVDT